jgi:hypothetical protein
VFLFFFPSFLLLSFFFHSSPNVYEGVEAVPVGKVSTVNTHAATCCSLSCSVLETMRWMYWVVLLTLVAMLPVMYANPKIVFGGLATRRQQWCRRANGRCI